MRRRHFLFSTFWPFSVVLFFAFLGIYIWYDINAINDYDSTALIQHPVINPLHVAISNFGYWVLVIPILLFTAGLGWVVKLSYYLSGQLYASSPRQMQVFSSVVVIFLSAGLVFLWLNIQNILGSFYTNIPEAFLAFKTLPQLLSQMLIWLPVVAAAEGLRLWIYHKKIKAYFEKSKA